MDVTGKNSVEMSDFLYVLLGLSVVSFCNSKHITGLNSRRVSWQNTFRLCRLKFYGGKLESVRNRFLRERVFL